MRTKPRRDPNGPTPQRAWPMVEVAAAGGQPTTPQPSEADAQSLQVEARTGLLRAGTPPPSLDRDTARALVEAGYMPLTDYLAIYGDEIEQQEPVWSLSVSVRFNGAVPRRNVYRATSVRYSLPKQSVRVFSWRRRA